MDIHFLTDYINLVTLGICLCLGFTIKQSLTFIKNKYIPFIMLCAGTIIHVLCNLPVVSTSIILSGMISGLASTGLYEALRNFIYKRK